MVGLATGAHLPNFSRQGEKGGDFLSGFLKKYDPALAWRKAFSEGVVLPCNAWLGVSRNRERKRSPSPAGHTLIVGFADN